MCCVFLRLGTLLSKDATSLASLCLWKDTKDAQRWTRHFPDKLYYTLWIEVRFGLIHAMWSNGPQAKFHLSASTSNNKSACLKQVKIGRTTCLEILVFFGRAQNQHPMTSLAPPDSWTFQATRILTTFLIWSGFPVHTFQKSYFRMLFGSLNLARWYTESHEWSTMMGASAVLFLAFKPGIDWSHIWCYVLNSVVVQVPRATTSSKYLLLKRPP